MTVTLDPGQISLKQLRSLFFDTGEITLSEDSYQAIDRCRQTVDALCQRDESVYGVNTGFGKLAQMPIDLDQLGQLQENLVLSHCCGVGDALPEPVVRMIILLKVMSLARGYSGVRRQTVDHLIALYNHGVIPHVPAQGSVGASGDLAPLAHLSAALIGVGKVTIKGQMFNAIDGLHRIGLEPLQLGAKEGLALINGTQVSTALALAALLMTERVFSAALVSGALTVDAMKGSDAPFQHRLHEVRGHTSQIDVAKILQQLLQDSEIRQSHINCDRIQDPYSLRCQPQVMGAVLHAMRHVAQVLAVESNGVSDNPIVFSDDETAVSGGNFHAEPVGMVADGLALAIAEIGALSERRIANLVDTNQSGLPAFLVENAGLNSGFMIAQVTAAALASENKSLAHPATVDSLPTSANQEDHVSMATYAARRLHSMLDNTAGVVAIELLAAIQGVEFHSYNTSPLLQRVVRAVRKRIPRYEKDRYMADDISNVTAMVQSGLFTQYAENILPSYE